MDINVIIKSAFSVLLMRQGMTEEGLGEEMYEAYKRGDKMPAAVDFEDDDSSALQLVKQIILDMTSYGANDRPNADYIQEFLSATLKKVNEPSDA